MQVEILIALLSLLGTLIGSISGIFISNKMVNFRLEALEKRVEKLCLLSERVAVVERDVKSAIAADNRREDSLRQ
ncbi:MAG: hypothetical protein IJ072_08650 [Oscillospiraceae bacterium]|nr:hypothetical protein [Oscillospiraceae bacterium]